ncbi:hypothetical protein PR003_g10613 [Phytophthora rubi]|uniref:Uncharacterized protein n=1 Tax=Phytophthora rubi TaxID=129364 RepID=A0A6A4FEU8_9STRA|nr:hypothetical protein PR002_g4689 [Phytophthora rubi]KAE9340223.1 hypothetical protein PR003_g10613 [Phytophthora rubi]
MHLNSLIFPDHSSSALTAASRVQDPPTHRFSSGDTASSAESSFPLAQSSPRGSLDASGLHLSQYPGSSFNEAASNLFPLEQDAPAPADTAREYERQLSSAENAVVDETNYLDCCADDDNTSRPPSGAQEGGSSGRNDIVKVGSAATDLTLEDFGCSEKHVLSDGKTFKVAVVVKIKGMPVKNTKYTELRAFCGRVGIKAYKNKSKAELLELIAQKKKDDKLYKPIFDAKMAERREPSRKQIQCPFRLLNIMFSDHFADRFVSLADQRSRADLDAAISAETLFWEEMCGIFVDNTPSEVIDNLIAAHPALDPQRIDAAKIVPHIARQLRAIWGSSHAAYRKAHIRYTASGTNKDDFYSFCHGRLDALYVYLD